MMGADDQRRPADRRRWDEGAHRTLVVALALTGLALAGILAERRELWLDEYHTWWLSTMSLPSLWTFVTGDVHPPLYFALMNGWQRLASDSPLALRLPSLLAYTASVFVFAAALRPAGGTAAVRSAAVALFALSPALVYYGSEARMYALTVLLATASLACIVRLHDERGAARQSDATATALAVAATLLVYTHYTGLFFLCGVGLAWLLRCLRRRAEWRPFVRFAVLAGVGTVLWLPVILEQRARKTAIDRLHVAAVAATDPASTPATRANGTAAATTPAGTVATTPGMIPWARNLALSTASIMGVFPAPGVVLAGLLAAPFMVLVVGVLMALRSRDELAFTLLVVFAVSAAGTLIVPIFRRYLLVAAPALFLLLWRGLVALQRLRPALVLAGPAAAVVSLAGCLRMTTTPEARPLAHIASVIRADTTRLPVHIISNYAAVPLRYHLRGDRPPTMHGFPVNVEAWWASQAFKGWATVPVTRDSTEAWLGAHAAPDLWLVQFEADFQDPWQYMADGLDRRYVRTEVAADVLRGTSWHLYRLTTRHGARP